MQGICSLLPGADTPILFSEYSGDEEEDSVEIEDDEEQDYTDAQDISNESVLMIDTNGETTQTLPQPTKDFMQPLTVECDPVSSKRKLLFLNCNLIYINCFLYLPNS